MCDRGRRGEREMRFGVAERAAWEQALRPAGGTCSRKQAGCGPVQAVRDI